jgi:hypothetical protein
MGYEASASVAKVQHVVKEALHRQREEMYDQFTELMRRFAPRTNHRQNANHGADAPFVGINPLRVKVHIEIPLFKGYIDAKALDEWLQQLESYFDVNQFSNENNILK